MRKHIRLVVLTLVMAGLLIYAWLTDRSTPAEPHGRFGGIVQFVVIVIVASMVVVAFIRDIKRRPPH